MKLFFTRHGQSLANTLHIISNRNLPHPLTGLGREQASTLAARLADKRITRIFSSPVPRAAETAEIVSKALNVPLKVADALREYDCGELEGRGDLQAWAVHTQYRDAWLDGQRLDECPIGGESFNDIKARIVPFINSLMKKFETTQENLLLVTHGGVLMFGSPHVLRNIDIPTVRGLPLDNTIIITAEPRKGQLVCLTWGEDQLV